MNIRKDWSDSSFNNTSNNPYSMYNDMFYTREETISEVQENFNIRRFNSAEGYEVETEINNNKIKDWVLIQSYSNPMNEKKEDKKMHFANDFNIQRGSLINWIKYNETWMALSKVDIIGDAYKSVQIYRCNNILLYKYNGLDINQKCIIEEVSKNSLSLEESKLFSSADSDFITIIPFNDINKRLPLGARFIFGLFVYKLIGIDDISSIGLLKLRIKLDAERVGLDNFTTGYADNSNLKSHDYSLNVINGNTVSAKVGDNPIQLNIELFDNKIKEASQSTDFIYQSDNEKICTIDNNGKVSFIGVGVCNITVKYKKDETVTSDINITVEPAIIPTIDKYSIKIISGSSSMILGSSNSKYTCAVYNNGIEDTSKTITWSLDNIALATIFSNPSNRSCVLKVNKTTKGTVKLRASLSDNTIFDEKSITIQSTF